MSLEQIRNFVAVSDDLATAGQPTEEQLAAVRASGFEVVVNLGLLDPTYCLPDEASSVANLGMAYHHVPVDIKKPVLADFEAFQRVMRQARGRRVFVHCAANIRVSCFVALFGESDLGWSRPQGDRHIARLWRPNEVWSAFLDSVRSTLSAPTISTRAAKASDAAEAIELLRRSFVELCVQGHQNDEGTLRAWLENKTIERFARWLADPDTHVIVAVRDGTIGGVGSIHRSGEIRLCYVLPGFQRAGIGRALLAQLEEHAKACTLSSVHLTSGVDARAFYERCGYRSSGPARPGFGMSMLYPHCKALPTART